MKKIIAMVALAASTTGAFAISSSMLAQQQFAMSYGANSNARLVGNTVYVPTTTRFDNKAPTYSPAYQTTVSNALSNGYSMNAAQSLAKNGPSYTSLNYANKGNTVITQPATTSKYVAPVVAAKPAVAASAGKICGYSGANYGCYSSANQLPANFRR